MTVTTPRREPGESSEQGSALVSAVLILLLLTALATGGFWASRGEMSAAQGYSQSVRALFVAESGLARFFASNPTAVADTMVYELYLDACADTLLYTTPEEVAECYLDDESFEEEFIEEYELHPPSPRVYASTDAHVYITTDPVMSDGETPIFLVRAEARVEPLLDPGEMTVRVVETYARLSPPFQITSVFAATGGVDFGGVDQHHHFDSKAKAGKTGDCGSEAALTNLEVPSGQFSLPLPHPDCPTGGSCPYKYHMKGVGLEVDSSYTAGSEIVAGMGIDWAELLSDSYWAGVDWVVTFDNSDDFEAYFAKSKGKDFKSSPTWPITRFSGDISTDVRVKGYGLLIVDGNVLVTADKIEWTGIMLVGGTISTVNEGHIHIKGAAAAGLSCTDADIANGLCRSVFDGDHDDFKYRPCEINQAWSRIMVLKPLQDLYREASPEG